MQCEAFDIALRQPVHAAGAAGPKCLNRRIRKARRQQHITIRLETDEASVERGIPKRRQQQAVIGIEPVSFHFARRPSHNMRSAQQRRIGNAGERAGTPMADKFAPERRLADACIDQLLNLCSYRPVKIAGARGRRCKSVAAIAIKKDEPIAALNEGLRAFKKELTKDPLAARRIEVAVITLGAMLFGVLNGFDEAHKRWAVYDHLTRRGLDRFAKQIQRQP